MLSLNVFLANSILSLEVKPPKAISGFPPPLPPNKAQVDLTNIPAFLLSFKAFAPNKTQSSFFPSFKLKIRTILFSSLETDLARSTTCSCEKDSTVKE